MPNAKFLKDFLTNLKKIQKASNVILNENCLATMLNKLPKKIGDLGSSTLPCQFKSLATSDALSYSGTSVNLMPYSFYKNLNLLELSPIWMAIHLGIKTMTFLRGICEDLLVKIDNTTRKTQFC